MSAYMLHEGGHIHQGGGPCRGNPGCRRVVVIVPEDAEQVERLAVLLWPHYDKVESARHRKAEITAAALREFATPAPPKPEEPQGLGAVVEDADGRRFVRWCGVSHISEADDWKAQGSLSSAVVAWSQISAVRVLSAGVTP